MKISLGDRFAPMLPRPVIAKYYLYMGFQAGWFVAPIMTLFVLEHGLTYTQVSVLNAVWWLSITLGQVPTGYVGDRIGRRNSMLVGSAVSIGSVLVYGQLTTFTGFLVIYTVWGVGITFRSGAESAWLYDTLKEAADEEEFTRIRGRGNAIRLGAMAISALVGGYLAGWTLYAPFVATAATTLVAAAVAVTIPQNSAYRADGDGGEDRLGVRETLPVIRDTLLSPPVRKFVVAVALFYALAWSTSMYVQPIAEALATDHGLAASQVTGMLGWLYAGFSTVAAVVSFHADRIEQRVGAERWALVAPLLLGVAFLVTAAVPLLAIPAFFLMRALLRTTDVLKEQYLNAHSGSVGRATVLSAASMLLGLARVPFRVLGGVAGDLTSPIGAVSLVGAGLLIAGLAVATFTDLGRSGSEGGEVPAEPVPADD